MPGTDVDLYYIYAPYYEYTEPEQDNSLDKIVIYVKRNAMYSVKRRYYMNVSRMMPGSKAPAAQQQPLRKVLSQGLSSWRCMFGRSRLLDRVRKSVTL